MAPRPSSIAASLVVVAVLAALLACSHADPPARRGKLTVPKNWLVSGLTYRALKNPSKGNAVQPVKLYLIGFNFANGTDGTCALPADPTTSNITSANLFNDCLVTTWLARAKGKNATFEWAVKDLTSSGGRKLLANCPILNLDLGRLKLDLLGLTIDLAPVSLDIVAKSGPGKLLGNLLCSLVGLLDGGLLQLGGLAGILSDLTNALQDLLGGLLG